MGAALTIEERRVGPSGVIAQGSSAGLGWQGLFTSFEAGHGCSGGGGTVPPANDERIVVFRSNLNIRWKHGKPWIANRAVPGTVHLVPSLTQLGVEHEGNMATQTIVVSRDVLVEVASEFVSGDPEKVRLHPSLFHPAASEQHLFQAIGAAIQSDNRTSAIFAEYAARAVAAQLLAAWSDAQGRAMMYPPRRGRSRAVAKATEYMQAELGSKLTLQSIAAVVGISITTLCHEFSSELGMGPHRVLVNMRLKRAQELLRFPRSSLSDIAEQCGFASQEHMTLVFRKRLGLTPGAYRKTING